MAKRKELKRNTKSICSSDMVFSALHFMPKKENKHLSREHMTAIKEQRILVFPSLFRLTKVNYDAIVVP